MKIKKEALSNKTTLGGERDNLTNGLNNKPEHVCSSILGRSPSCGKRSPISINTSEESSNVHIPSNPAGSNATEGSSETWHETRIFNQALLSMSTSGQINKSNSNGDGNSVLPKICNNLQPVDDIKLTASPAPESSANNTISHSSFSSGSAFSTSLSQLPPVTLPYVSLPFGAMQTTSLTSSCAESTHVSNTLSIAPLMETCELSSGLQRSPNISLRTTNAHPNLNSSLVGEVSETISPTLAPVISNFPSTTQLCRTVASLSSKDDSVTVVYSSVPKMEPCSSHLIHSIQKSVPLPSMSEVKSSLTNHLSVLPQTQCKMSDRELHKNSDAVTGITTVNSDSHSETLSFNSLSSAEVGDNMTAIKLDDNSNSSEFGNDTSVSLSSGPVKFGSDNSNIASSIVIPVSSDVILTKLDGQNTSSSQDVSHIITIPLPPITIYNTSLNIPMPLSLCNGGTTGTTVQMTPTIVPNLPYFVSNISTQSNNPCWSNSAVTVNVTSSSHQNTSVTSSLPVSVTSVASAGTSVGSSMIQSTANSVAVSSQVTSIAGSNVPQDPVCYSAEILSQLSKAGVLPTMSSSQVSSVLSALGSDSHVDLETDNTQHGEILSNQVLQGDKVSILTQTDSLEMNLISHDEKMIQLLGNSQLLDHQMNGSHMMITTSANQTQTLNSQATHITTDLNSSEQVSSNVTETKQVSPPFPKIVAMVLNAPTINEEKLSVTDVNIMRETGFKNSEMKVASTMLRPTTHQTLESSSNSLHDFLVLPSSSKPQRKRSQRTSALREMLLGKSEVSEKNLEMKKPKGRPKKTKGESVNCTNMGNLKGYQNTNEINEIDWVNDNKDLCFTKELSCFKCKFCPFLSLEGSSVMVHVKEKHTSEVSEVNIRQELKCPGCPNVFFTTNSLEVHLKQDHQVNTPELKAITSTAIKVATENKLRLVQPIVKKKKIEKKLVNNGEIKNVSNVNVLNMQTICDIPEVLVGSSNSIPMLSVSGALIMSTNNHEPGVLVNEENKIRVKNLNSVFSENANNLKGDYNTKYNTSENNISVQEGVDTSVSCVELRQTVESSLKTISKSCIDEKHIEPSMYIKPVTEEQKKKRGRPKGSRSSLFTSLRAATDKDGERTSKKPNVGHRCNVDNCAVTMRSPENIEYHRSCHNGLGFRCPECTHTHCHWNGMSIHLWRAHMMDMELYTCDQCNYKTNSYAKLINLHKWIHGSERPFLCDSCGKGFKNRKQLRNHKAIHQSKQTKAGECEICGRAFNNKRMLRMHLDNVHNKLRPHLCNYCGYSASSVSSLKMHMRKHTGEKPFRCHVCDYCTADHNSLRRHKMRHTGDKPYKCPHCPYACIQSSTYKAHLKTKHPGMDDGLMFSCNLCSFRSVKEENYRSHLSEHKRDAVSVPENQSTSTLIPLEPDFEEEEITGISDELITDSQEYKVCDISDPQEYKICETDLKISHQGENHSTIL